jgi:hypothetical protein
MRSWATAHRYELLAGGFGVTVAATWLATRSSRRPLQHDQLLQVLECLSEEFFGIFSEMAQVVQSMTRKLEAAQSKLTPEQFAEILMQRGLAEKLEQAQERVVYRFGFTIAQVEVAQTSFAQDPAVQLYVDGLAKMHDECFRGVMPLLPGVEIPAGLTTEAMLGYLERIAEEKLTRISAAIKDFSPEKTNPTAGVPPPELTKAIQEAYDQSEAIVLEEAGIKIVVFKNALAQFLRDPIFIDKKIAVDRSFQERFKDAMALVKTSEVAANGHLPVADAKSGG